MANLSNFNPLKNLGNIGEKLSDFEEVPHNNKDYFILGKGNFGYVEKMKSKKNNNYYAIKKLNKNSRLFSKINFRRETEIMDGLNHNNIIKFYGYFSDKERIEKYKENYKNKNNIDKETQDKEIYCLVLEYVPNGTLEDYYKNYKEKFNKKGQFIPLNQEFIINIFKQLLNGLKYLHKKSIIHRDIKPDNILLDQFDNAKISDFGISTLYYDNNNPENANKDPILFSRSGKVGHRGFICPEIEKGKKYDYRADIFSLGLTMLYLMSYDNPIKLIREKDHIIRKININGINKSYNKYLIELVLTMLNEDIDIRPSSFDCYEKLIKIEEFIQNNNNQDIINLAQNNIQYTNKNNNIEQNKINKEYYNQNNINNNQNNFKYNKNNINNNNYNNFNINNNMNNYNYAQNININNNNNSNINNNMNNNIQNNNYNNNQNNYNNNMNNYNQKNLNYNKNNNINNNMNNYNYNQNNFYNNKNNFNINMNNYNQNNLNNNINNNMNNNNYNQNNYNNNINNNMNNYNYNKNNFYNNINNNMNNNNYNRNNLNINNNINNNMNNNIYDQNNLNNNNNINNNMNNNIYNRNNLNNNNINNNMNNNNNYNQNNYNNNQNNYNNNQNNYNYNMNNYNYYYNHNNLNNNNNNINNNMNNYNNNYNNNNNINNNMNNYNFNQNNFNNNIDQLYIISNQNYIACKQNMLYLKNRDYLNEINNDNYLRINKFEDNECND